VALGQVFSEYFGFPCQSSFHQKFSILTITRGRYNRPFSGRRAEWTQYGLHPPLCQLKKIYSLHPSLRCCGRVIYSLRLFKPKITGLACSLAAVVSKTGLIHRYSIQYKILGSIFLAVRRRKDGYSVICINLISLFITSHHVY
jgi:hypothetical protein